MRRVVIALATLAALVLTGPADAQRHGGFQRGAIGISSIAHGGGRATFIGGFGGRSFGWGGGNRWGSGYRIAASPYGIAPWAAGLGSGVIVGSPVVSATGLFVGDRAAFRGTRGMVGTGALNAGPGYETIEVVEVHGRENPPLWPPGPRPRARR